jgi:sphingomyelin phosphodiesterase
LVALKALAALGNSPFVSVLTDVCKLAGVSVSMRTRRKPTNFIKVEDDDVCEGLLKAEGPIIAHDLREITIGSRTSKTLCTVLLGLCEYPAVETYSITFPKPKPAAKRPAVSGKTPIQVVHISDTHVDLSYTVGANYNCTKPICCRPYTTADAPGNNAYPAGKFGNPQCDPPVTLQQSMVAAIKSFAPNAAFTIFTGDVVAHDVWSVDKAEVLTDLNSTYSILSSLNLVYATMGNHDTAPVNSLPPSTITTTLGTQWAYDALAADWTTWIGTTAASNADNYGAYSIKYPGGNLRVISLNTVFYYTLNFWMYEEPLQNDPQGQFAWLVNELQGAETAGERVYIISHIPSGSSDYFHGFSNTFNQIVNRYEATIAGMFYGHTHLDEFEISYSDYNNRNFSNAIGMSYITPSMTPTSGAPTFRVYSVDPVTYGVLDYTEYTTDITASSLVWKKYYSAKATYGSLLTPPVTDTTSELTPAFWHNVTTVFEKSDSTFQAWYGRKSRGFNVSACDATCKAEQICMLRSGESQYNCDQFAIGINISKRDEEESTLRDECEGTKVREVFNAIANSQDEFIEYINAQVTAYTTQRLT